MRTRPDAFPRFSTAARAKAAFLALSWRLPRQTGLGAANPGIIDLDLPPQRFSAHIDHRPPELMEHHPRSFIVAQSELPLQAQR
jgi:hypothetical protein